MQKVKDVLSLMPNQFRVRVHLLQSGTQVALALRDCVLAIAEVPDKEVGDVNINERLKEKGL